MIYIQKSLGLEYLAVKYPQDIVCVDSPEDIHETRTGIVFFFDNSQQDFDSVSHIMKVRISHALWTRDTETHYYCETTGQFRRQTTLHDTYRRNVAQRIVDERGWAGSASGPDDESSQDVAAAAATTTTITTADDTKESITLVPESKNVATVTTTVDNDPDSVALAPDINHRSLHHGESPYPSETDKELRTSRKIGFFRRLCLCCGEQDSDDDQEVYEPLLSTVK